MEALQFETQLTRKQYIQVVFRHYKPLLIGMCGVTLLYAFYAFVDSPKMEKSDVRVICFLVLLIIAWPLQWYIRAKKAFRKQITHWELTEDGILRKSLFSETKIKWDGIYLVTDSSNWFIIYIEKSIYWPIPKSNLTEFQINIIKELIDRKKDSFIRFSEK